MLNLLNFIEMGMVVLLDLSTKTPSLLVRNTLKPDLPALQQTDDFNLPHLACGWSFFQSFETLQERNT